MKNRELLPIPLAEAARLLAVSTRTVRRLIDTGEMTAVRIGSTLALAPSALPEPLREALSNGREDRLLSLHDVAARLDCSPSDVRALTMDGSLRAVHVGRSMRWSRREIEAVLAARDLA